jgi:hypothetical protein
MSTTPEMLRLRKGLLANLPVDLTPGAISITTDEGGIYLDTATERVRLSDVRVVSSLSSVADKFENILYFATSTGDLAFWNPSLASGAGDWDYIRDNSKLNKNLGAAHANKVLTVNASGDITPDVLTAGSIKAGADPVLDPTTGETKSPDAGKVLIVDNNGMAAVGVVDMSSKQDVQIGTAADEDKIVTVDNNGKITLSTKKVADKFDAVHAAQLNKILVTDKTTGAVSFADDLTGSQVKVSTNAATDKDLVLVVDANGEIGLDTKKMSDKQDVVIGDAAGADAERILTVDAAGKITMSSKKVTDKLDAVFAATTDQNKVVVTDATGKIVTSTDISIDELNTLDGIKIKDEKGNDITIQDQLDGLKADITTKLQAADAMVFKGVINDVSELPTTGVEAGWTYKIGTVFEFEGNLVRVGDLLIANADQGASDATYMGGWSHVESGYVDDYASKFIVNAADNKVVLDNNLGALDTETRGSITFVAGDGMAVETKDLGDGNAQVTFGMSWGSF